MDADWVNPWGILAVAVGFLLIAPEIIGIDRLRLLRDAVEECYEVFYPVGYVASVLVFGLFAVAMAVAAVAAVAALETAYPFVFRIPFVFEFSAAILFAILLLLLSFPLILIGISLAVLPLLALDLPKLLLAAPNPLRALVFGTGVVLLFGGMAAQFAATF